jgi:hypothetical protein
VAARIAAPHAHPLAEAAPQAFRPAAASIRNGSATSSEPPGLRKDDKMGQDTYGNALFAS